MTKKPRPASGLTQDEKRFIRQNCLDASDEELAKKLKRDPRTIRKYRTEKLGVIKGPRGTIISEGHPPKPEQPLEDEDDLKASANMTKPERERFFQRQLTNSQFYFELQKQLTDDEINFYLEEWGSLCEQFSDIVATEKRQIDELIKAEIMANRVMRSIRVAEDEIEKLADSVERLRSFNDVDNDEDAQERDQQLCDMIRTMSAQSNAMARDYQNFVDMKNKILEHLNGRRKDRLHQIEKSKTTFIGLVEALQDQEVRRAQGKHLELLKRAKDKKAKEWRRSDNTFPDGSRDFILLDHQSITPKTDNAVSKILTEEADKRVEEEGVEGIKLEEYEVGDASD